MIILIIVMLFLSACGDPPNSDSLGPVKFQQVPNPGDIIETSSAFVTLAFDPNLEPDIEGYRLHYGEVSRSYSVHKNIGLITENTINGLSPGTTYYFAVTAYDSEGLESDYSDELSYSAPTNAIAWQTTSDIPQINQTTFSFSKDPIDGLIYFYTHFQWQGHPNVKYRLTYKHDLNAAEWTEIEVFNVRPSSSDPTADRTIYSTYRYYPVPTAVFYSVKPVNSSTLVRLEPSGNFITQKRHDHWKPVGTLRVIDG